MNIIKVILALLGLMVGIMLLFGVIGFISTILWYGVVIGLLAAAGYGGWKLFRKAEDKYVGAGSTSYLDSRDYNMSWEEYERKYLNK